MKYIKLIITLIFAAAGALIYFDNKDLLGSAVSFGFKSVPFYEVPAVATNVGFALLAAFLLGMVFTLVHSSLNLLELMGKNRRINKLESEIREQNGGEQQKQENQPSQKR